VLTFYCLYLSQGNGERRIACHILIQNEQLEQVHTFPYLGSLITEDGECMTEFCTRINGVGDRGIAAENMDKSQHIDFNKDTTNESASVAEATYGCETWTLRKNEEIRLHAIEIKRLRKTAGFMDSKENK